MSEPMDLSRFEALVAAYGARPSRWPEDERAAAEAFAKADDRAGALLAEADAIDALLFVHQVPEPSRLLRTMVIETAPRRRRPKRRVRLWWTGLAFAVAAASGALAGSAATAALDPAANLHLYERDDLAAYDVPEETAR